MRFEPALQDESERDWESSHLNAVRGYYVIEVLDLYDPEGFERGHLFDLSFDSARSSLSIPPTTYPLDGSMVRVDGPNPFADGTRFLVDAWKTYIAPELEPRVELESFVIRRTDNPLRARDEQLAPELRSFRIPIETVDGWAYEWLAPQAALARLAVLLARERTKPYLDEPAPRAVRMSLDVPHVSLSVAAEDARSVLASWGPVVCDLGSALAESGGLTVDDAMVMADLILREDKERDPGLVVGCGHDLDVHALDTHNGDAVVATSGRCR